MMFQAKEVMTKEINKKRSLTLLDIATGYG